MNNYIQKIVEDFDFNSIQNDNDKASSFAENILGAVDLGLPSGTLWCKCNLGAKYEYDYGDYYSWGELTTKDDYDTDNYNWNFKPKQLPPEYDVATQTLGSGYSIPTKNQCKELIKYTDHEWIKNYNETGINGMLFTGKNNNSIFIPAAGTFIGSSLFDEGDDCAVWSSNLASSGPGYAWYMSFDGKSAVMFDYARYHGRSIRSVFKK